MNQDASPSPELCATFQSVNAGISSEKRKRPPPFSLRLTGAERARLERDAGEIALGAYVKARAFGNGHAVRTRRTGLPVAVKQALAQALALLGGSRTSSNLNQIAKAANTGALPLSPELESDLRTACTALSDMKALLQQALGLQPEAR